MLRVLCARGALSRLGAPSLAPLRQAPCRLLRSSAAPNSVAAAAAGTATGAAAAAAAAEAPAASAVLTLAPASVGWWLMGCSGAVFGMVVLGGITRLTRSGLSMTEWRPQGTLWPKDEAQWMEEFEKYKRFPEFIKLQPDMKLQEFKSIYFYEWSHRMAGRAIGLIFGVPLLYFAARGKISRPLAPTLGLLFALGGSQGLVGWWMVRSGLDAKLVAEIDGGIPRVSPYRLAAHLTTAFTIYSLLVYTGLGVLQPRAAAAAESLRPLLTRLKLLSVLVGVTAVSGAFVAGMQAGLAFNTFPLMEGRVVPEGYFSLQPAYRNLFEHVPSVQFHHRCLALTSLASISAFWLYAQRLPLPRALRFSTDLLLLVAVGQVSLGVATLLNAVPVHLGSAHQAGALTLFSVLLFSLHACRVPAAASAAARIAPRLQAKLAAV